MPASCMILHREQGNGPRFSSFGLSPFLPPPHLGDATCMYTPPAYGGMGRGEQMLQDEYSQASPLLKIMRSQLGGEA